MKKYICKIFFTGVLGICILGFVANAQAAEEQSLDKIVAIVNKEVITQAELDKFVRNVKVNLKKQKIPFPPDEELVPQVLEHIIVRNLQLQLAKQAEIDIDDETLDRAINDIAKRNNKTLKEYKKYLKEHGETFEGFKKQTKEEITVARLRQEEVGRTIHISDKEVEDILALSNSVNGKIPEYHVKDILIALPEDPTTRDIKKANKQAEKIVKKLKKGANFGEVAVAESKGELALKGGDLGWRKLAELPTVFSDSIKKMKKGEVSDPIRTSNGLHILKLADSRGTAARHFQQQTHVRHILIKPDVINTGNELKARLTKYREQIIKKDNFEKLAKKFSQDPGSASHGGELGWVEPGVLDKDFETAMNNLKDNEISQPIHSQFGWHLIQVLGRKKIDNTDQFRRSQARRQLFNRKFQEASVDWMQQLRNEAYVKIM